MKKKRQFLLTAVGLTCFIFYGQYFLQTTKAQNPPLTIPEIFGYLNTQLPNDKFKSKAELLDFLIDQITKRRVEKPLTADIENIFRQVGATDDLINAIQNNNPTSPVSTPTPSLIPTPLPSPSPSITTPITLLEIRTELRKLKPGDSQNELIATVKNRKVSELLNADIEAILVRTGATLDLIQTIKNNQVSATTPTTSPTPPTTPTPTPTPIPTPLTLLQIRAELRKIKPEDSQKELIALIELRKVSEPLDKIIEEFLKSDGATPELIEAIKKNVTISPAPTNTP